MDQIMNIQRYKWPVIVAAGLHGALFLSTPDRSIAFEKHPVQKEPPLREIPVDAIVMEDPTERSTDELAAGGTLAPDIPEVPMDPLEKPEFTVAKAERLQPKFT